MNAAGQQCFRSLDSAVENAADLNRPVSSRAQQIERRNAGERTHFMHHLRAALSKETLDRLKRRRAHFLKDAKPERLRGRRADAVEHRVGARAFHPLGAAIGKQLAPRFRKPDAGLPFSAFQPPGERQIRKHALTLHTRGL